MSDDSVQDIVDAAMEEGTFSFAEVAQGRSYPQDTVSIYLDEATAYKIAELEDRANSELDSDVVNKIDAEIAELRIVIEKSKYTFKIHGIPLERRDELLERAREQIKPEFDSFKNFVNGRVEKTEKDSPERDRLYNNMLWAEHITEVVGPDGRVDRNPGIGTAEAIRKAPISQQVVFTRAIQKLVVAADSFEARIDDDFLAKS